jgi:hypothetical protein
MKGMVDKSELLKLHAQIEEQIINTQIQFEASNSKRSDEHYRTIQEWYHKEYEV